MHTGVLEMLMGVQLLNSDGTSCRFLCSGGAGSRFASKDHSFYPQISDEIIGTENHPCVSCRRVAPWWNFNKHCDDWYKATTCWKGVSSFITPNFKHDLCSAQWMEPPRHSCRSQVIFFFFNHYFFPAAIFSSAVQSKHVCVSSCRSCVNREESACCCLCVHTWETAQQRVCVCVWALQHVNINGLFSIQNIFHPVKRLQKVFYSGIYAMWLLRRALHCVMKSVGNFV